MTSLSRTEKLKEIYYGNEWLYCLMYYPKYLVDILRFRSLPATFYLKRLYKRKIGKELNLKKPLRFTEKIQWLKLYHRKDLYTICADKHLVRGYVEVRIGTEYLIPQIIFTKEVKDLKPENLPNYPFIIKTNHDSSGGIIIRDKTKVNWTAIRKKIKFLLNGNYYWKSKEWAYKNIQPGIVVEKLLMDDEGNVPRDYKFYCFNGKVKQILVVLDREENKQSFRFNEEWQRVEMCFGEEATEKKNIEIKKPPKELQEMIRVSERLAKGFPFVRVDLYLVKERVFFGELTFYPLSGLEKIQPDSFDFQLGQLLKLPIQS